MNDKKLLILIGILLLLISIAAGYLFYRLKNQKSILTPAPGTVGQRQIPVAPSDPIKKFKTDNGLTYQIEGVFSGELTQRGQFLEGDFIIREDPEKRKIKTFVGTQPGTTFLGKYQGSFTSDSTWQRVETVELLGIIKEGDPVLIRIDLTLGEDDESKKSVGEKELILDSLIEDFGEGQFDSVIPKDFGLVAARVGLIQ